MREQARRINELEAADNRRGQELEVIRADRRALIQSLQQRDRISTDMERMVSKRLDRHRQVLNRFEDGLADVGVKQESVLTEIERLSGQVCHCGDRGSASERSQLSYASPSMAGASSASSAGYEDAEDRAGEEGEVNTPLVVLSSPDPIRIPGPVVRGQRAVRSSGVIRSLKSDRAPAGPYFRRGGRVVGRTREFVKALADVVAARGRRHSGSSSSLPPSSLSRESIGEDRTTSNGSRDDSSGVPARPFVYDCYGKCGTYPGWGEHPHSGEQWRPGGAVVRGERGVSE